MPRPVRTPARPQVAWRRLDGVLLLDKPSGITSTAALARAKRALRAEKGGHTGTLDPMASGLLPLCFGEATKFAADGLDADKSYDATIRLGVSTDSGDADGAVVETRPVHVDRAAIDAVLARFRGTIAQVPPMHSAIKRDGRPLYDYARRGLVVEREARTVTIARLEVLAFDDGFLTIGVDCSKGTYIRTLGADIGDALGCGGHLTALRRTRVGAFDVADAIGLAAFESEDEAARVAHLAPIDTLIAALPRIDLDDALARRFVEGQRLAWPDASYQGRVRVYGRAGGPHAPASLLGTGLAGHDDRLAPVRLVARADLPASTAEAAATSS